MIATNLEEFKAFPKIPRLSRECVITEKIDGTNAQVIIRDGLLYAVGSRNRYLTLENDNFGFCKWALENQNELVKLGDGTHYGEWWGPGIQRGYGLKDKKFTLFRVPKGLTELPSCVSVVPVLYEGPFDTHVIDRVLAELSVTGSRVSPGFMRPEGIVIYHKGSGTLFKKTFEGDEMGKGEPNA